MMTPDDPVTDASLVRRQFDAIESGAKTALRNVGLRWNEAVVDQEALAGKTVSERERPRCAARLFWLLAVRDARQELGRCVACTPCALRVSRYRPAPSLRTLESISWMPSSGSGAARG